MADLRTFREKLNSRKLAMSAGVIIGGTALLVNGYITSDNWMHLATFVTGGYMATQAWVDKDKK